MTTHEAILGRLVELLATRPDVFPPALLDEPEPTQGSWEPVATPPLGVTMLHSVVVQDGPPPSQVNLCRGNEAEKTEELELECAIGYAVQAKPTAGIKAPQLRSARRAQRDAVITLIAELIAADRTLGLGQEVYAEVAPPQREDDVAFENALPCATAVVPIRVLYTAVSAAH